LSTSVVEGTESPTGAFVEVVYRDRGGEVRRSNLIVHRSSPDDEWRVSLLGPVHGDLPHAGEGPVTRAGLDVPEAPQLPGPPGGLARPPRHRYCPADRWEWWTRSVATPREEVHVRALLVFALAGLFGQLVDGALGMAFGVTASTVLLPNGFSPAVASASVHLAEVGTTLTSGISHWRFGNVSWPLVRRIGIPGAIGAFAGATVLSSLTGP